MEQFSIQQLEGNDWQSLKEIRLQALLLEPQSFGSNLQKESQYDGQKWREFVGNGSDRAMFILRNNGQSIGMVGVVKTKENPEEVALIALYVQKDFRGLGLSKLLYQVCIDWAKKNNFSAILVSHRESNTLPAIVSKKFNFQREASQDKIWADGKNEKQVLYRLELVQDGKNL